MRRKKRPNGDGSRPESRSYRRTLLRPRSSPFADRNTTATTPTMTGYLSSNRCCIPKKPRSHCATNRKSSVGVRAGRAVRAFEKLHRRLRRPLNWSRRHRGGPRNRLWNAIFASIPPGQPCLLFSRRDDGASMWKIRWNVDPWSILERVGEFWLVIWSSEVSCFVLVQCHRSGGSWTYQGISSYINRVFNYGICINFETNCTNFSQFNLNLWEL